jgi:hypothetical protein
MKMSPGCRPSTSVVRVTARWLGWWLLGAASLYGCGLTDKDGWTPVAPPHEPATPGANAGTAGMGPTPLGEAGEGGEPACGAGSVRRQVPVVEPAVSARYGWDKCGRIAPGKRPGQVLFASDGSILTLDEDGAVRGYASGATTPPDTLIDAAASTTLMVLSNDGTLLLTNGATGAHVYRSKVVGTPITAQGGMLEEQLSIDTASSGCGAAAFSADSKLIVGLNQTRLCAWQLADGKSVASIDLKPPTSESAQTVGAEAGGATLTLLRDNQLLRYTLAGDRVDMRELPGPPAQTIALDAVLSPDGLTLLTLLFDGQARSLLALDVATGATRWQADAPVDVYPQLTVSADGFVLASSMGVYRIEDGQKISGDAHAYSNTRPALNLGGTKKLVARDQIAEWNETTQEIVRLYGAHTRGIVALDMSADGRYLASHSGWAIVWELAEDFAQSVPLYSGSAGDGSWDVALAPDGGALVASGDNVMFWQRSGAFKSASAPPPSASLGCLSADWAFSPDGCWVAGTHYGSGVQVASAHDFSDVVLLPASNCAGGVAFSPDGAHLLTASLELFETGTWRSVWSIPTDPSKPSGSFEGENAVEFSPDSKEAIITRHARGGVGDVAYTSARYNALTGAIITQLPQLSGDRVRYSPEGHWIVSGDRALHQPSGTTVQLDPSSKVAIFTPQGDIISGEADGSLVHYCRSSH